MPLPAIIVTTEYDMKWAVYEISMIKRMGRLRVTPESIDEAGSTPDPDSSVFDLQCDQYCLLIEGVNGEELWQSSPYPKPVVDVCIKRYESYQQDIENRSEYCYNVHATLYKLYHSLQSKISHRLLKKIKYPRQPKDIIDIYINKKIGMLKSLFCATDRDSAVMRSVWLGDYGTDCIRMGDPVRSIFLTDTETVAWLTSLGYSWNDDTIMREEW